MGSIAVLWYLQKIDNKRRDLQREADNAKIRRETKELALRLEQKERDLEQLMEKLKEVKRAIRRGERENVGKMAGLDELETRIYSGQTTNLQELTQMQRQITQLKQEGAELEEEIIASMLNQEVLEEERDALAAAIEVLDKKYREKNLLLEKEMAEFESQMGKLLLKRQGLLGEMREEWLQLYEKIGKERGGQAVAAVVGDLCQGCHISLPTNLVSRIITNERLQTCPSCGRILYYQGKEECPDI